MEEAPLRCAEVELPSPAASEARVRTEVRRFALEEANQAAAGAEAEPAAGGRGAGSRG